MVSEGLDMDSAHSQKLAATLASNQTLQTIYEFKQSLKNVWNQHSKDQAELLARLQAWCADAEASGISSLREFAQQLRGYRAQFAY